MEIRYYKNLDGVRAIAALLVLVFHVLQSVNLENRYTTFIENMAIMGHFGVSLFFVLSGFLITRILINSAGEHDYFKKFYIRRSLRIFPLYYLFLMLWYFVYPHFEKTPVPPLKDQLYYYTYMQSFPLTFNWKAMGPGHFWTLAIEEHFYLFWPLAIYFINKKYLKRFCAALIVVALITRWLLIAYAYNDAFFPLGRFDALALGAILAIWELNGVFKKENAWKFLILTICFMALTLICNTNFIFKLKDTFAVFKYTFIAAVGFGIIGYLLCLAEDHFLNRILTTYFFRFSGRISYGLYVFYPLVFGLMRQYVPMGNWVMDVLCSIAVVYIVATFSYYFFEMPFLKLKRYFNYK